MHMYAYVFIHMYIYYVWVCRQICDYSSVYPATLPSIACQALNPYTRNPPHRLLDTLDPHRRTLDS